MPLTAETIIVAALVAGSSVAAYAILREMNSAARSTQKALCDLLAESNKQSRFEAERLIEKLLATSQASVSRQHSLERQDRERLDAYAKANEPFMRQPPPLAEDANHSDFAPNEVPRADILPLDLGTG